MTSFTKGLLIAIENEWMKHNHQRLGQFLVNTVKKKFPDLVCPEIFYMEDHELIELIYKEDK